MRQKWRKSLSGGCFSILKHLNIPSLSIQCSDFVFVQVGIGTQQHKIVLAVAVAMRKDQFRSNRRGILIPSANLYRHAQKIPGSSTSVFAAAEDVLAGAYPPLKTIMDLAAPLHHGDHIQLLFLYGADYPRSGTPTVK